MPMTKKKPSPDPAARRLATLAAVLETPLDRLESFLDLLGEAPMDDRRIADAQHVMGLCTPVCSYLVFPKMEGPSCGKELLKAWQSAQEYHRVAAEVMALDSADQVDPIKLSPKDQAAFAAALVDPPPVAPAMERAMRRRAELLTDAKPKKKKGKK